MRSLWAIARIMVLDLVRKKDFYVLLIFMLVLMAALSSQSFFNIEGISQYIKDFGYTTVMLFSFIIAVTFSAKQIPAEIESRTVYPFLAKPVKRSTLIAGKFLGGVLVSVAAFSLYYLVFVIYCAGKGQGVTSVLVVQGYFLGVLFLCLVSMMAVFFSIFLTFSANVTVLFLIYFFVSNFSDILRNSIIYAKGGVSSILQGSIFYMLPHFEFFDMRIRITHGWDPLSWPIFFGICVYTVLYCGILFYFASLGFKRKSL